MVPSARVRAILDANVLVSASSSRATSPGRLDRLRLEGRLGVGTSRPLLAEFGRVLERKVGSDPERVEAAVGQVTRIAMVVEPSEMVQAIAADPADDRVLEAGCAYGADVIVSGDRHLLDLGAWSGIEIISPPELADRGDLWWVAGRWTAATRPSSAGPCHTEVVRHGVLRWRT